MPRGDVETVLLRKNTAALCKLVEAWRKHKLTAEQMRERCGDLIVNVEISLSKLN